MSLHSNRPHAAIALIALAAISLAACRNEAEPSTPSPADSALVVSPEPMEAARGGEYAAENVAAFNDVVYRQYAQLALGVSRREQDSIIKSTPITQIEAVMSARLRRQDSVARASLAAKYGITRDSIDAILAAKNVPKR